ncbi:MAG: ABC transporter substrate-binding protein [Ilumatobacteraceae bacterium]
MSRRFLLGVAGCLLVAACGSGQSILDAGNEPRPTTTVPPTTTPVTAAPGQTVPSTIPTTTVVQTTTTTPLDSLPPCPVDALPTDGEPVEITFWHGLGTEPEKTLIALTEEYHASQTAVRVTLQNQGGYGQTIDKYYQSGQDSRPQLVSLPEYMLQQTADSGTVIPVGACIEASEYDTAAFLPGVLESYRTSGVQWAMPFNVSDPVLYYNRRMFEAAGLDPDDPPRSIEELRTASQAIVDSGAARYGIAFDSGVDSGGGWFIEQWFAKSGEFYADNGNGRLGRATQVLYSQPAGVELLSAVQSLIADGLAVSVGDNPNGQDALLKLADPVNAAAMTISSSGALGTVINVLDGGLIPGITSAELGIGSMPGPDGNPLTLVGGASLYIVANKGDAEAAAAWDYVRYLVDAQVQSKWAAATGYVPVREDATELDPLRTLYTTDPRFQVGYDSLQAAPANDPSALGPVVGPLREVRSVTAGAVAAIFAGADVASSLAAAAQQSDALITDYNARN